ncbi:uncharacterized protein LOC128189986 [Crassostrea angulata]|uniref:uncharacterized protein LOC128189986 n=1 Tax=Magallana angulata TaxID=2784310 RepID=UPI0022B15B48|nr:uncharacterized protein LOC128189986 [Crassostrea angulata]
MPFDFDDAYNLTSWMTDTTTKNIIQKYLILCPEQDMCLGSMFKRGYPIVDKSACTPCECDDSCVRRSTCCPSKFYRQTDTPDFIEYQKNTIVTEKETPMSCFEPLWNPIGIRSKRSYWMIKTCPNNINCISPPSINISSSTPVTSLATNQTYRTIQCALCNQEEMSSLVEWEKKKFCNSRSALFAEEDFNSLYQSVFALNPLCNIGFYPPTFYEDKVQPCVEYTHEDKCNESNTENNVVDAYLIKACQEFYLPYIFYNIIYKNIYCALCEHDITNLPIQYISGGFQWGEDFLPNPFSALIDFQQIPDKPIKKRLACAKNQMLDNRLNMCLDIECEVEYRYHNQSCSLVHQMVNENNYEINLIASVNDNEIHPTNISSQSILNAFQVFLRRKKLGKYLCRISILGSVESDHDVLDMAMVIELSIGNLHNTDQMLKYLLTIFSSFNLNNIPLYIPYNTLVNISFSLVGQSFHVYGSNLFNKKIENRFYVHPGSGKEMVVYNSLGTLYQGHESQNCLRGQMMSIVADWYRCPKVKIKTSDARMDISNFSVCLLDYGKCFTSIYFKQSLDKRSVSICLEQYLQSIKVIKSSFISSNDSLMSYFSLVCLSLSSLGSLATVTVFLLKGSCSRIADVNIIILATFVSFANITYILSKFFLWSRTLCIGIGMLVHFNWLSVVCWMSLCSFQVFQAFTSFHVSEVKVVPKVLSCLVMNLIICLSLVVINVVVSFVKSNRENFGYSVLTCYIADSDMVLFTFALPVGVLICINMFMFAVTVLRISKRINVQKSQEEHKMRAYFRLSTITGVTWLFGFLAQFTGHQLFDILHTVFSGGQGLFLYLAFGLSLTTKQKNSNHSKDSKTLT